MSKFTRRPSATRDLRDIYRYYARRASLRIADRFLEQAEATFTRLARRPGIGTRYQPDEPHYADLRYSPVSGFRTYIVFYRPIRGGIEVLRVLHGARDIAGILAEEFGTAEGTGDDADAGEIEG